MRGAVCVSEAGDEGVECFSCAKLILSVFGESSYEGLWLQQVDTVQIPDGEDCQASFLQVSMLTTRLDAGGWRLTREEGCSFLRQH
jgi:hypothetical protein